MPSGIAGTASPLVVWEMDEAHGQELERRGLSVEAAVRLGWRPCVGPTNDLWISIPYFDNGKRVGTKRRSLTGEKSFNQVPGSAQILWNVDCLRDPALAGFPLIITEGEMDALAAIQSGFPKTVSVPGGAPERDDGEDGLRWAFLQHAKAELATQKVIVLAVDSDANGSVLQAGLARRLGKSRCQVLHYPTGKDLNDVLLAQGSEALRDTLAMAVYLPIGGLVRLSEIPERIVKRAVTTCVPGLDAHLRIRRGDLIVVTGPPGHGKSTFVTNVAANLAWYYKATTAIATMESAVVPDLRRVLRTYRAECLERDMSERQKTEADAWIERHFVFLQPGEEEEMTLTWMLERFAAAHHRHDASVCIIDPWNEVSISDKPVDWTTEQWVSQSLRLIKVFARANDVAMVVVAHPAKMRRDRMGKIPKPGLWDIADSASWANRCDLGVVIYRPDILEAGSLTEVSVEKSRDHYVLGVPGSVSLAWNPEQSRFKLPGDNR
jgi:twinkle protein